MVDTVKYLSATTLIGDKIENPQHESLGDLKEIMLNTTSGKIEYAVLSFGGVLGMGSKLFAVPWSALSVDHVRKTVVLNVSKDRLKDAPGFDKDNWPNFADPAFAQTLNTYYAR
ncbi:MAG: PRC-barrel domain-containing protein [Dokdonella sp.]